MLCAAVLRVSGQARCTLSCTIYTDIQEKVMKLSSSLMLNSDESVVLQELSLNVDTLRRDKNPPLLSIERSSGSVEGSSDQQKMP